MEADRINREIEAAAEQAEFLLEWSSLLLHAALVVASRHSLSVKGTS